VREKQAAECLENAIGSVWSGPPGQLGVRDEDLLARVRVAERLVALDLVGASRVREALRAQLQQATRERQARAEAPPGRRPWVLRRPLLAAELALLLVVVSLAVLAPRSLAAFVEQVARVIQIVRVGEHTQIVQEAPRSEADKVATLEQHKTRLAKGESWFLSTPYGGFGGHVPPGERAGLLRVSSLDRLRASTRGLEVPTGVHRDELVRFDHAFVAPGGGAFMFFGSGPNEVFLSAFPVGEGRSVAHGRSTTAEGAYIVESPTLKTEEISLGGQTLVWDPDPVPPATRSRHHKDTSALRWERSGVSYSLMGRSLTREEALSLFLSLQPIEGVE
jgi:hypothetical protein